MLQSLVNNTIDIKKYTGFYNTFLGIASNKLQLNKLYHLPADIQVEPTSRCNLSCIMCGRTYINRKNGDMSIGTFKNLVFNMKHLRYLTLNGLGEPLLNPDIFEMISFAKSRGIRVRLSSNATILDHSKSEKLISTGLDQLFISLDGASSKTYETIRKGADFESLIENIRYLMQTKEKHHKETPHVTIDIVGMRTNLEEIPSIIELASSIGVKSVNLRHVYFDYDKRDYTAARTDKKDGLNSLKYENLFSVDKACVLETFRKATEVSKKLGVSLHLPSIAPDNISDLKKFSCVWPWLHTYIDYEGYVTPCCICPDKNEICFGNINDMPFKDIWNSKEYRKFRSLLANNNFPKVCETCMRPINETSSFID